MEEHKKKVITRFAPSPTGFMHIGGIRTALFAWLWARKNNGTFILRIEDTDKEREVAGSIAHIQKSLQWLELDWEYGPDKPGPFGSCIQSERLGTYMTYARVLIEKGYAYPDPYTQEQVEEFRKTAETEKRAFLYRDHRPETVGTWDGTQPLRFKVPEIKRYHWHDAVRGDLEAGEEALDDFILIKGDGYPTYNFAHIVDDHNMGVTHIFRGDEFISSTPRFLSLYDALGFDYPVFVSLPPILRDDKTKKLGKRDGAKDILEYQTEGYLPDAMVNFLALIGWNPGTEQELFSRDELLTAFSIERIQKSGGVFNDEKLDWMNKEYIKMLSPDVQKEKIIEELQKTNLPNISKLDNADFVHKITPVILDRVTKWSDVCMMVEAGELEFFFEAPTYPRDMLFWKTETDPVKTAERLHAVADMFERATHTDFESSESVRALIWAYAEAEGRGGVLWPLRVALSGREKSPDPFTLASILGKAETLERIQKAIEILK